VASLLQEQLLQVESRIMNSPIEIGFAFTPEGDLVFSREGDLRAIPFEPGEDAHLKGTVFTHNHPLSIVALGDDEQDDHYQYFEVPLRGLSLEDIYFACQHSLAEIRVVDSEYLYSLLPAADQDTFSPEAIDLIHEAFHFAYDRFSPLWEAAAEADGFDLEMATEASLYYPVRTLLLAAASVGMAYSVSPLGALSLSEALQIEDEEMQAAELLDD
jgi:hypothetical protein